MKSRIIKMFFLLFSLTILKFLIRFPAIIKPNYENVTIKAKVLFKYALFSILRQFFNLKTIIT